MFLMGQTSETRSSARKYPARPAREQAAVLNGQGDAARALWNYLHAYYQFYADQRRWPSWAQMDAWIREARREVPWLRVLPAQAAQQVLRSYRRAWENHWAGTHARPTWKSRRACRAVDVPQARQLNLTRLNRKWWLVTNKGGGMPRHLCLGRNADQRPQGVQTLRWFSMYCLTSDRGAPPTVATK